MPPEKKIDYGPLESLIGKWTGDKGLDIAPEPDGSEENPYFETITFTAAGDVSNAGSQVLSVVHYRQIVQRKSDQQIFHDQTGYWLWDAKQSIIMQSIVIPRAVCVLAGANYRQQKNTEGQLILNVSAAIDNPNWGILQSPFMQQKARTTAFEHQIVVGNGQLFYAETTMLDIYGKIFEHTDTNKLTLR